MIKKFLSFFIYYKLFCIHCIWWVTRAKTEYEYRLSQIGEAQLTTPCSTHRWCLSKQTRGPPESPPHIKRLVEISALSCFTTHTISLVTLANIPFFIWQSLFEIISTLSCWRTDGLLFSKASVKPQPVRKHKLWIN